MRDVGNYLKLAGLAVACGVIPIVGAFLGGGFYAALGDARFDALQALSVFILSTSSRSWPRRQASLSPTCSCRSTATRTCGSDGPSERNSASRPLAITLPAIAGRHPARAVPVLQGCGGRHWTRTSDLLHVKQVL